MVPGGGANNLYLLSPSCWSHCFVLFFFEFHLQVGKFRSRGQGNSCNVKHTVGLEVAHSLKWLAFLAGRPQFNPLDSHKNGGHGAAALQSRLWGGRDRGISGSSLASQPGETDKLWANKRLCLKGDDIPEKDS